MKTSLAVVLALGLYLSTTPPLTAQQVSVRVEIDGLDRRLAENARATMSLSSLARAGGTISAVRARRLFTRGESELAESLQPFGYYRPRITSSLDESGSSWTARYSVETGPALTVNRVDVSVSGPGASDSLMSLRVDSFPLAVGDTLIHSRYTAGKRALAAAARERGFLDARFDTAQIRIDTAGYRAEVVIRLASGPQHYFGPVSFDQDLVKPEVLRGYLSVEPGAPYRQSQVDQMQAELGGVPYFSLVEVTGDESLAADTVPLDITVTARRSQQYGIGVGYGTDTGPRGSFNFEFRRLNRRGHHADGTIRFAAIERSMSARYLIPALYPKVWLLSLSTGFAQLRPDPYRTDKFVLGPEVSRARGFWRQALGLRYEHDDYVVGPDSGTSNLYVLAASVGRTKADDQLFANRGTRIEFDLSGAHSSLLSSATFLQALLSAKAILPLAGGLRLVARGEAGYLLTSQLRDLPPTTRFFTGGDQSVRGFEYLSLGPRTASGQPIGGRSLAVVSGEVEWYFTGKWGVAAFLDTGNAFDSAPLIVEHGAGIGMRWRSPVGPIRVDGAWAVSRDGSPFRIHLNIGPDF